jgi:hypothetical protein
LRDAHAFSLPR